MYADRMGSITTVVEAASGSLVAEYSYDSFGTRSQNAGSLFQFYGYMEVGVIASSPPPDPPGDCDPGKHTRQMKDAIARAKQLDM